MTEYNELTVFEVDTILKRYYDAKFKKFRIGKLFEKLKTPLLVNGSKFDYAYKNDNEQHDLPLLYAKSGDNGIMYWGPKDKFLAHSNCIGIIYNGAVAAGLVYPMKDFTSVLGESYLVKTFSNVSFLTNVYLSTALKKAIYSKYSRELLATWPRVKDNSIMLPVTQSNMPDYTLMEDYIKVIQQKYIEQKQVAYQKRVQTFDETVGTKLSDTEIDAIVKRYHDAEFSEFRIGELFTINTGTRIESAYLKPGVTHRISVKNNNNGVYGTFDIKSLDVKTFSNFISINFFGNAYYHPYSATLEMKVHSLKIKDITFSKELGLYLVSALNKRFNGEFGYGNQLSSSKLKNENYYITLPTTPSGTPDYTLMEDYIKVIQQKYVRNLEAQLHERIATAKTLI